MPNYNDLNLDYQGGDLDISSNKLTSLVGCPNHITGDFIYRYTDLTSLIGGPQRVDGNYDCTDNNLKSFDGCASHIGCDLYCWDNNITSLVGIHKIIKSCKEIWFDNSKITVGGIGLLLIDNLEYVSTDLVPFKIIHSYLGTGSKGMMACRAELISKGCANYAKL